MTIPVTHKHTYRSIQQIANSMHLQPNTKKEQNNTLQVRGLVLYLSTRKAMNSVKPPSPQRRVWLATTWISELFKRLWNNSSKHAAIRGIRWIITLADCVISIGKLLQAQLKQLVWVSVWDTFIIMRRTWRQISAWKAKFILWQYKWKRNKYCRSKATYFHNSQQH